LFINSGGHIFSTNYDMLLYWVLMRQHIDNATDGFGRELENTEEVLRGAEAEYGDLIWGLIKIIRISIIYTVRYMFLM
jgi:hypothetical protein